MGISTDRIRRRIEGAAAVIASLDAMAEPIHVAIDAMRASLDAGGMILTCGNGGSAAEALHLAEELTGRYRLDRPPLRGVCLSADPTAITCIANDFGYEHVFSRQVEALARPGDCLVTLTTSGESPNALAALKTARKIGLTTVGLLGKGGGQAEALCDHPLVVLSDDTAHIQEAHQVIIHLILEAFEPDALEA